MEKTTCKGITQKGNRCQKTPISGKEYCHLHISDEKIVFQMDETCPICLQKDRNLFELSCGHKIHLDCVKEVPDIFCVICRQEMVNLPSEIEEKIHQNEKKYREELEEEDRQVAQQSSFQLENLFSVYVRPPPQIEVKYALLYLKSQNIPFRYIPSSIKIRIPKGHPRPPCGVFFSSIVSHTVRKMKEDTSDMSDSDSSDEEEDDPFDGDCPAPRIVIDALMVDPREIQN